MYLIRCSLSVCEKGFLRFNSACLSDSMTWRKGLVLCVYRGLRESCRINF